MFHKRNSIGHQLCTLDDIWGIEVYNLLLFHLYYLIYKDIVFKYFTFT